LHHPKKNICEIENGVAAARLEASRCQDAVVVSPRDRHWPRNAVLQILKLELRHCYQVDD